MQSSKDLTHIIGGFGWVTNSAENPSGATFYLDEIKYDKSRPDELRFLVSFETLPSINPDRYIKNASFIYDNALALLAFSARGNNEDLRRAKILADAFVHAQNNDRYYTDGRLRNAYMSGDLIDHLTSKVRIPGWWDPIDKKWYEDEFQVSTYTGDLARVMIALLSYYKKVGGAQYLEVAMTLGEWIETKTKDNRGTGGYTGGYKGWETNPQKITWKSTEHNIDIYVAFMLLYEVTGDMKWKERALHAKSFIEAMWDGDKNHFWTGTLDDGVAINYGNIPADIQAGAIMAINSYPSALSWVEDNYYTEHDGFKGFDFNTDKDGVWFEGTAQMAIAYQINGDTNKSDTYLAELQKAQAFATNTNGKGIVAACHDGVTTGFEWTYFNRLHIGATAWYIFTEKGYNPYWGSDTTPPLAPINITSTPDNWTNKNSFSITWTNPDDLSGIAGAYYKLESAPTSNTDGTYTTSKPFTVSATAEGGQDIYVWLKDRAGNNSYLNRNSTILYYDGTAPTDGNLTATPGDGQISLSWLGFSDNGGSGLKLTNTYKVVRDASSYPDSQCTNGTQVYLGTDSSTIEAGLTNGTTYYYQVCAYDNAGNVSPGVKGNATPQGDDDCFIATAAYGSYLDPHIKVLRYFRDNYLLTNPVGRAFIKIYYRVSPPIAELISEHEMLKIATRWCLTPIVYAAKYPAGALLSIIGLIAISIVWKIKRRRNLMIKLSRLNKI